MTASQVEVPPAADAVSDDPNTIPVRINDLSLPADNTDSPSYDGLLPENWSTDTIMRDIGLLPVTNGLTPFIEVDLPSDAYSFTVLAYGHDGTEIIIEQLQHTSGSMWISDVLPTGINRQKAAMAGAFPSQFFSKNRAIPSTTTAAFLVPNTPDVEFVPGTYRFRLGAFKVGYTNSGVQKTAVNRPLYVTILVRRAPSRPETGTLNLTLHFTGARNLTAESARTDAVMQKAIELMKKSYKEVGVHIGTVDYVDVNDDTLQTVVLTNDTCSGGDLDRLLRFTADVDTNHLNLFFVERFQCLMFGGAFDLGQGIGGISGGIPGLPLVHGSTHSGVAVSLALLLEQPEVTTVVMAHETGHFLGLYHTQESGGLLGGSSGIYDNIADTPDTSAGATANLMNYSAGTSTSLTPGQGYVMRNNPLVH